jgi:flagellar motility protein MotE (MotC chaperone)
MARKATPEITTEDILGQRPKRWPILAGIVGGVLLLGLLLAVLHLSGALNGMEEGIYSKFSGNKVMAALLSPMHHPDFRKTLTLEESINVIDLRREMTKAAGVIEDQKSEIGALKKQIGKLKGESDRLAKVEKDVKNLKRGGGGAVDEETLAALVEAQQGAAPTPAPAAAPVSPTTKAAIEKIKTEIATRDYRKIAKIVEAMSPEQAFEVFEALENMKDENFVVEVMALMKEKTVATILQSYDPNKTAELFKKLAARKTT